ncbi:MAG: 2-C-methyl-D-erythritol 4-phosphate cytidylyltransferase, partial [Gemmatimonadota bacterium]|nr:2-C-methyl-D-erythritol 4-phosphate cytidylyltransferase [Gemmatimonadota bacterium]
RDVGAIVVAAGRGSRVGSGIPKQYRPLAGTPIVLHALRAFAAHPDVAQVVLVVPASDVDNPPSFLADILGEGLVLAAGGAERRDSVTAGLAALRAECTVVLVHDGARPFVDRAVIDGVIEYVRAGESAIAAVPLNDTVKESAEHDRTRVGRTLPRERLWRAQTPQGFPRALLAAAHAHAAAAGLHATDDAVLIEACGGTVRLVPDSVTNLKITTSHDLELAECLAGRRS